MIDLIQIHRRFKMFGTLLACIVFFSTAPAQLFGDDPPFGSFDTPPNGSTVAGCIPVTGWALDDFGIKYVKIYWEDVTNNLLISIGDACFIEGIRLDVAAAFPTYPNNTSGWGYMMLTNSLPGGGTGAFKFHAIATDTGGNEVTLGIHTVTIIGSTKPFGTIDTPPQCDGVASGSDYVNWGWVLTPWPNDIPIDGSTIDVYVDGINLGHPTYNIYRPDIAGLFPGYANSNGAGGYFILDTTAYAKGLHTICWVATDSNGNSEGIGSRYFTII